MQSPIERIINNDRKARETVAAAEQHRSESAAELVCRKAEIRAEVEAELAEASKSARERSEKITDEHIAQYRRNAEEIGVRMDTLYEAKKDEWVETYTRRIIEG